MLSNSGCQSWQNRGVQDFLKLLADALLYRHHPGLVCRLGNQPSRIGITTDVKGVETQKRLKHLSSSLDRRKDNVTSTTESDISHAFHAAQAAMHQLG